MICVLLETIREIVDEGTAQDALALSVNEDDALPLLGGMFLQGLTEDIHLVIEDVASRHARRRVQKGTGVEVNNDDILIALALGDERISLALAIIIAAHITVVAGIGNSRLVAWLSRMIHFCLELFGIDDQGACHFVILYDGIQQSRLLEEFSGTAQGSRRGSDDAGTDRIRIEGIRQYADGT